MNPHSSLRDINEVSVLTFICLRATSLSYDVAHRTVRSWHQNSFGCFSRWPWNTLCNRMCGVACCRKEWGEAFSSIFTTDTKLWSIPDWGSSNTRDKYMCRLRHINDPVLSSLKMEGIRLLFHLLLIYFHIPVSENLNCSLPEDIQMYMWMGVLKDDLFQNHKYELNVLQFLKVI
jgi:hypothetical protein